MSNKIMLQVKLDLERCPHCSIALPHIARVWGTIETHTHSGQNRRFWAAYKCESCGGVIIAASTVRQDGPITEMYPRTFSLNDSIPDKVKAYLSQAIESLHAPAGAVILAASAVDAMLKNKGYKTGSLYSRIDKSTEDHVITNEMAAWAHEVRLDANEQRHADEDVPLPEKIDAERVIDFSLALAEYLFVLPARIKLGRERRNSNET